MVVTETQFELIAPLYRQLIFQTLKFHGVSEVRCENKVEHYFDRLVVKDDGLDVYKYGLKKPLDNLYFDFTNDYARCLCYIEDDLYLAIRNGKPMHEMYFTFNNK